MRKKAKARDHQVLSKMHSFIGLGKPVGTKSVCREHESLFL